MRPPDAYNQCLSTDANLPTHRARTRAVLFDLDGTLIDTSELIFRCFEHSWRSVCGLCPRREALLETFGIPLREAMSRLLAEAPNEAAGGNGESAAVIDRLLTEYRAFNVANHDALARPFEGVRESVVALRSQGYLIGVVTSKGRELGRRGLEFFSLDGLVDAAIFLEDTSRHKPEPDPILAALARLGARADRAAYVGDSPHDMISGRAAGVRTVAALWGPGNRAELERQAPDHLAESPASLIGIFAKRER